MNDDEWYYMEEMALDAYMENRVYDYTDIPWHESATLGDWIGE